MRPGILFYFGISILSIFSCVPVEKIASHEFVTGYYKLKTPDNEPSKVYLDVIEDSIIVYPLINDAGTIDVDTSTFRILHVSEIKTGNDFYGYRFVKNSLDLDLNTILLKYRPARGAIPNQLNANLNGSFYVGFRKDYFKMITKTSKLHEESTYCRHLGFDFGLFAGIGITPINPSVTGDVVEEEYDGIVFQKGIGSFLTFDRMSLGIVLGFDNLLDKNSKSWLFNQQPYLGLSIGIANF
jgi:hypothetical protein